MHYLTSAPLGRSLDQLTHIQGEFGGSPMRKFLIALSLVATSLVLTAAAVGADTIGSCC